MATATNLLKRRVMSGGGMLVGPATWALTSNNGTKGKIGGQKEWTTEIPDLALVGPAG